jgi:hypothetical protein
MLLLIASFIGVAGLSFQARPGTEVVAVAFPVWWDSQQAFAAAASANAAIVRETAVPSLLVVRPDGADGLSRLHAAGAWLAIDPQAIAACFTTKATI